MSALTMDRRPAGDRARMRLRGRSGIKPGSLLKSQIPIRTWADWDDVKPGFVEIDCVGHEGGDPRGGANRPPGSRRPSSRVGSLAFRGSPSGGDGLTDTAPARIGHDAAKAIHRPGHCPAIHSSWRSLSRSIGSTSRSATKAADAHSIAFTRMFMASVWPHRTGEMG